ncbi:MULTISPECIES: hypothetical protein [unclassified Bacillus (in: firmicutes)]|uniref:hypothetical protein n=1 Tax=unclassified Bacillus (in: firmicutes) TaxID=185979 RepID=UPI0008EC50B4|nr:MULTISPECIES: hypothetical protein [unclassified Bacillus (in: firmicutes)]SFA99508.1 hypothetical protein SAMN02799634_103447 [Bacillus sp. UNCCL13]SFQ81686.1 hypothetical protein SAMN04488577_2078 [Bacillus sp. cl95]
MVTPEEQLEHYIISSKELLTIEDIKELEHFFNHREYEMAFEGLIIELTNIDKYPNNFSFSHWKSLGKHFKLDKETVFDEYIWEKFMKWGKSYL